MIEDALPFTVDEIMLNADGRELLETRGLLQFKNRYTTGRLFDEPKTFRVHDRLHLEFMFVKIQNATKARKYDWLDYDYNEIRVFFEQVETVALKRAILSAKLVIRVRPKTTYLFLNVDPIKREIILNISWKDIQLAKCFESAINLQVSDAKFKRLIKDIEQS